MVLQHPTDPASMAVKCAPEVERDATFEQSLLARPDEALQ
jgi:hypothetical protein